MAKRGRPSKNGVMDGGMFFRALRGLEEFDAARASMKHSSALSAAVEKYRQLFPKVPMSESTMKRIHLGFRGKQAELVLIPVKQPEDEFKRQKAERLQPFIDAANDPEYPDDERRKINEFLAVMEKMTRCSSIRFGPRPSYPRANAKALQVCPTSPV